MFRLVRSRAATTLLCTLAALASLVLPTRTALRAADAPASQPAPYRGFFWKVTSPTATAYLLGSVHVASKDMYPLPKEIETAFATSKNLVVELDVNKVNQAEMMALITTHGMYPAGDSVEKHLTPEALKTLTDYCKKNNMPMAAFSQMKPWMIGLFLTMNAVQELKMDMKLGIDKHFLDAAGDKKVIELETADAQIKIFSKLDEKQQEAMMLSPLKGKEFTENLKKLIDAWKTGDVKLMEKLVAEENGGDKKLMEEMVDKRNVAMAAKIEELLKAKETTFVVVGSAHLIGDAGIVKMLEKKKYKVEQVLLTPAPAEKNK